MEKPLIYYSERKRIKDGVPIAPVYHTGDQDAMERQYHLNCANVLDANNPRNDLDICEWGTLQDGVLQRNVYTKPEPEEEPEDEPVEPVEPEEPEEPEPEG